MRIGSAALAAAYVGAGRVAAIYVGAVPVWVSHGGSLAASGGSVSGGSAEPIRIRMLAAAGLAASGGAAVPLRQRALAAAGGSNSSGSAAIVKIGKGELSASGGSHSGGDATAERVRDVAASGSSVSGGAAAAGRLRTSAASGGSVSAGAAAPKRVRTLAASGGSASGGSATISTTPATVSLLYANGSAGFTSSRTYSGVSFGAADSSRRLLIMVFGGGTARTLTSVTAAGSPVTMFVSNSYFAAGFVDMPTGTSGDIVVTWSGSKASFAIAVYRTTHLRSTTPTDGGFVSFSSLTAAANLTVQAGGIAVGYLYGGGSDSRSVTWSNLTEAFDAYIRTIAIFGYAEMHSGAASAFAAAQSPIAVSAVLSGDLVDSKTAYIWAFR